MVKIVSAEAVLGLIEAEGWETSHLANALVVELLMEEIPPDRSPDYYIGLAAAFDYTRRKYDKDGLHTEEARYASLIAGVGRRLREALSKVTPPDNGS